MTCFPGSMPSRAADVGGARGPVLGAVEDVVARVAGLEHRAVVAERPPEDVGGVGVRGHERVPLRDLLGELLEVVLVRHLQVLDVEADPLERRAVPGLAVAGALALRVVLGHRVVAHDPARPAEGAVVGPAPGDDRLDAVGHLDPVVLDRPDEAAGVAAAHELLEDGARVVAVLPALPRLEEHGVGEGQAPGDAVVHPAGELLVEGTAVAPRAQPVGDHPELVRGARPQDDAHGAVVDVAEVRLGLGRDVHPEVGVRLPRCRGDDPPAPGPQPPQRRAARGAGRRDVGPPRVARRRHGDVEPVGRGDEDEPVEVGAAGVPVQVEAVRREGEAGDLRAARPVDEHPTGHPALTELEQPTVQAGTTGPGGRVDVERPDVPALDDEAAGGLPLGPDRGRDEPVDPRRGISVGAVARSRRPRTTGATSARSGTSR